MSYIYRMNQVNTNIAVSTIIVISAKEIMFYSAFVGLSVCLLATSRRTTDWHGRPQAWARGGTCPLWKCCKVFLCISSYSKMLMTNYLCSTFYRAALNAGRSSQGKLSVVCPSVKRVNCDKTKE